MKYGQTEIPEIRDGTPPWSYFNSYELLIGIVVSYRATRLRNKTDRAKQGSQGTLSYSLSPAASGHAQPSELQSTRNLYARVAMRSILQYGKPQYNAFLHKRKFGAIFGKIFVTHGTPP